MTLYMWIASLAWVLLVIGYFKRRCRNTHIKFMCAGIFTDILLVLYLQLTRGAIQKALEFSLEILKQLHIGVSTMALLLYFPILYLGYKLSQNPTDLKLRKLHKRFAIPALILRTLGFIFMFSMWNAAKPQ